MSQMHLIVGGTDYIRSHTNKALFQSNFQTLVYDNLISGHRYAVKWGDFVLNEDDFNNIAQRKLVFSNINPINPSGRSKLMLEHLLGDYCHAYGLTYVSLRYFNAVVADSSCAIDENHNPETHLIPLVLGIQDSMRIFGNDYDTSDGTAIRDYLYGIDIANAHVLALKYLLHSGAWEWHKCKIN